MRLRYFKCRTLSSLYVFYRLSSSNISNNVRLKFRSVAPQRPNQKDFNPFAKRRSSRSIFDDNDPIAQRMCVTILGNGALGQPKCIGLFTERKAFLFNCGEGVGRLLREYEIEMFLIKNVFITQNSWQNVSGLHDIYLTNNLFGLHKMNIYGPPGVEYFHQLLSSYPPQLKLKKQTSTYIDENIEIDSIQICPLSNFNKNTMRMNHKIQEKENVVFAYSCKIFGKNGDLDTEKCIKAGVPIGPELLKLKLGEDIILPSGRVICSEDVTENTTQTTIFLVIDCPTEQFLDAFLVNEKLSRLQVPSNISTKVTTVFHFTPHDIVMSRKYQKWMRKFHHDTEHYILNTSNCGLSSEAVCYTQNIFHLLHPELFKELPRNKKPEATHFSDSLKVIYPPPMLHLYFRPNRKLDWSNVANYNSQVYLRMIKNEIPELYHKLENLNDEPATEKNVEYPEVVFLGTSSSVSTAYRNVSAIFVKATPQTNILLDCGEGGFMQIVRYFGESGGNSELLKLSCVFVSHKHTDHYMGLFQLVQSRIQAFENSGISYQPLVLILPSHINDIFRKFCDIFEPIFSKVRIFSCKSLMSEDGLLKYEMIRKFLKGVECELIPVIHCDDAYGIILQHNKWKIVYSGDTAPCQKLIDAGENCTLLIHEASIEDDLVNEAIMKTHSTPSQVVDIAEKMNAKYTIMTHFSKRYMALPVLPDHNYKNIGYAFDFMKVNLQTLPLLPNFLPTMKLLFEKQLNDYFEKTHSAAKFENVFLKAYRSVRSG